MAETHDESSGAHGPNVKLYMLVFFALSIFTGLSFAIRVGEHQGWYTAHTGAAIIMGVAVLKASLVGSIFMHLRWDWSKLYFLIVPSFILATMMMIVLLPDILLAWR
jgi:cytochrome c oxidase subunit IV